jgi:hypothetical protein
MTLALQAGENVDVTLRLEHSDFQVEGSTIQIVTAGAALPRFQAADPAFETQLDERRSVGGLTRDFDRTRTSLGNLRVDWHNDFATLTSLSAFATYDLERNVDTDFSPLPFLATLVPDEQFDSWSQELRLASADGAALDWMFGVYAERSEFTTLDRSDLNGPRLGRTPARAGRRFEHHALRAGGRRALGLWPGRIPLHRRLVARGRLALEQGRKGR